MSSTPQAQTSGSCDGCGRALGADTGRYELRLELRGQNAAGERETEDNNFVLCGRCQTRLRSELLTLCGAPQAQEILH